MSIGTGSLLIRMHFAPVPDSDWLDGLLLDLVDLADMARVVLRPKFGCWPDSSVSDTALTTGAVFGLVTTALTVEGADGALWCEDTARPFRFVLAE